MVETKSAFVQLRSEERGPMQDTRLEVANIGYGWSSGCGDSFASLHFRDAEWKPIFNG